MTAEIVEPQAVFLIVTGGQQPQAELGPLGRIDDALEDRVLHPLPVVQADLGHPTQAAPPRRRRRGDVVADENHHPEASPRLRDADPRLCCLDSRLISRDSRFVPATKPGIWRYESRSA